MGIKKQTNPQEEEYDENEDENIGEDEEESEEQEGEEVKNTEHKKITSSKKREKDHLKTELAIRDIEQSKGEPREVATVEDHEKQILSDPNNSMYWVQYAGYILDKVGLQATRKIFERAINTIDITMLKEKLNLWVAYMNLEMNYGSQDTFKSVVERALEINEKKNVYIHLISIYKHSGKFDMAMEVYKILVKNYFSDQTVWKNYIDFLFEVQTLSGDQMTVEGFEGFPEPKEGLNRALQVLAKERHIEMLIYYGQLQYKYNHVEEARNTFESVLKNYPKRSDIWLVFIDKEIKHGNNLDKVRNIFEKCLKIDFKTKFLKTIIKKYLEFERDHGTQKSLEHVKQLTQSIISSRISSLDKKEEKMDVDQE